MQSCRLLIAYAGLPVDWHTRHPSHCFASFASSTPPSAVSSMSSQYPRAQSDICFMASAGWSRAESRKLHHALVLMPSRQMDPLQQPALAGCCSLRGRFSSLTYSSGLALAEASQRAAARCGLPVAGRKRCLSSTRLR
ncbi:hypothetical protein EJ02DRAFT_104208 [Clathrospora elynae]|uniref:Uncharacterized protein n=1 Tax=Clathrospora elynae TaxID=706981 RepID=A0A6A5SUQ4_9PLEO|nr:hypothetical protein EJ02DRAFT_104208 [Clathrospora elynae]